MPKGRIFEEAAALLREAGYKLPPEFDDSRKLIIEVEEENFRFILSETNGCSDLCRTWGSDLGIAGKDVMLEEDRDVYELLDLNISKCYLAVAGLPNTKMNDVAPKIATKYPTCGSCLFSRTRRTSGNH